MKRQNNTTGTIFSIGLLHRALTYICVISFIVTLSGCTIIPKEEEALTPVLKVPPKVVYSTVEIKKTTFEKSVNVTGTFVSTKQKDLSFQNLNGRLKTIKVKPGDRVKKGDILAELITDNFESQVQQQELDFKKCKLNLQAVNLNSQKDIDIQKNQLDTLKKKLKDMMSIPEAYSQTEIEDIKAQVREKEITYNNLVETTKNSIATAENDAAISGLKLENLRQSLANTRLVAPMDGVINYVTDVRGGGTIDVYETVVSIADDSDMQLSYSGDKVPEFVLGMKVSVKVKDLVTEGTVVMTSKDTPSVEATEEGGGSVPSIQIKLSELPKDASIGDYADITLFQVKKDDVIVIDKNLVKIAGDRKFVSVLENGIKKERDIEAGDENQTEVVVVKGLSEGDKLIK